MNSFPSLMIFVFLTFCVYPQANQNLLAQNQLAEETSAAAKKLVKKFDFGDAATAEIYKQVSNSDLWIYRFDPPGYDPASDQRPSMVCCFLAEGGKVERLISL